MHPANANKAGWRPRVEWFAISTAVVAVGVLLVLGIPDEYFLATLLGSLGILVCFMLPSGLFLALSVKKWKAKGRVARKLSTSRLECAFLGLVIAGGAAAVIMHVVHICLRYQALDCLFKYHYEHNVQWIQRGEGHDDYLFAGGESVRVR